MFALKVHVRTIPAPTLVTVAGELDLLTAPQLRDHVLPLPDDDLVLDISGVRLLAAAGLRVVLELQNRRARAGAQVVLAGPSVTVRRVLCATGLDKTLPMAASAEDAVALVTAPVARVGSVDPLSTTNGHSAALPLPPRPLPRSRAQQGDA
jgi:stage II sporulation protein AA (anti-sigma F factor antagonist)